MAGSEGKRECQGRLSDALFLVTMVERATGIYRPHRMLGVKGGRVRLETATVFLTTGEDPGEFTT